MRRDYPPPPEDGLIGWMARKSAFPGWIAHTFPSGTEEYSTARTDEFPVVGVNIDGHEGGAVDKSRGCQFEQFTRETEGDETVAAGKSQTADGTQTRREVEGGEVATAEEGTIADTDEIGRRSEGGEAVAIPKGGTPDMAHGERKVIGRGGLGRISHETRQALVEEDAIDSCKLGVLRMNIETCQMPTAGEGADPQRAKAQREGHAVQMIAMLKSRISDFQQCAGKMQISQSRAAEESLRSDVGQALGKNDLL